MLIIPTQQSTHGRWRLMRLARQQGRRVGTVKALLTIKENHLFRLALGMEIRDNFQRTSRLHQCYLHLEASQVDAENGAGCDRSGKEKEREEAEHHFGRDSLE
jgi:hypothetical protein